MGYEDDYFDCPLCQHRFLGETRFLRHLDSHTPEEVRVLKKIAERQRKMTEEEIRDFNREIACGFYRLEQEDEEKKGDEDA